ncbi:MAG: HAD-IA family hydrolase [Chloroflexi bacterium]|nr:HAD-IA family hydrolase [Chloroflexota bacterium]
MKAIIFDWDLTLWNSWDIHVGLMRRTADALGLPRPSQAEIAHQYSQPFLGHLAHFFQGDQQRVLDTYLEFYHEAVSREGGLYPRVVETLGFLKDQGQLLAVFSDKRTAFGELELDLTGLGPMMTYTLFLEDGRPYKPDPEGLIQVINALGVSPSEAIYVGDTYDDMDCARRAGLASGAALWGCLDREALLSRRPEYYWQQVDQMLDSF